MMKNPNEIDVVTALNTVAQSEIFIFAAGYEERSIFLPDRITALPSLAVIGVLFDDGPTENSRGEASASKLFKKCEKSEVQVMRALYRVTESTLFEEVIFELCEKFEKELVRNICVDVSGMPQFVIMEVLAQIRSRFPCSNIVCLYAAACDYPPSQLEIRRFLSAKEMGRIDRFEFGLKFEPGEPLFPKRFAGVGQRRGRSVMALFAGYEKDRSHAAYDAVNPAKLILFHSLPVISGACHRLAYSQAVHSELGGRIERSIEVIDNLDIVGHVNTLMSYYESLYDLYDLVLVPVHSKMQTIACFLFWERFPDVQVIFPVPVEYRVSGAGVGVGQIYQIDLPPNPGRNFFGDGDSSRGISL